MLRLFISLLIFRLVTNQAIADHITVTGNVSGVWDVDTVLVTGEIVVPTGQSLSIEPGVKVLFAANVQFQVQTGSLITAIGNLQDSILFEVASPNGHWKGILLNNASDSSCFAYCRFRHGSANYGGAIYSVSTSATIENCWFDSCHAVYRGGAIYSTMGADCKILHCKFKRNSAQYGGAICADLSDLLIAYNLVIDNIADFDAGIRCQRNADAVICNNVIINNNSGGISAADTSEIFAYNNIIVHNKGDQGGGVYLRWSNAQIINNCITGNEAQNAGSGGGIFSYHCSPLIKGNIIKFNNAVGPFNGGGGIFLWSNGSPIVENNFLLWNHTAYCGGGVYCTEFTTPIVRNNIFARNTAGFGGGFYSYGCSSIIYKNSFVSNISNESGGSLRIHGNAPNETTLENSILWNNSDPEIYITSPVCSLNASYCDIQSGWPGLSMIDSDPLFVDPHHDDYRLLWGSPCIDAGHPDSLDPDGTRSDMGAFNYEQRFPISVLLTPHEFPYLIQTEGGSMDYTLRLSNHDPSPYNALVWCDVTLPDSSTFGPVLGPVTVTVPASTILAPVRLQAVPGSASMGVYHYNAYAVVGSDTSKDIFMFGKLGSGIQDSGFSHWTNSGDELRVESVNPQEIYPSSFILHSSHPNPFNASTAIYYQLPTSSLVRLKVYDTAGRLVTTLVNGWREAGSHEVTFDGSDLSSGVYLARLTVGNCASTLKMVSLK
jgi:hypothetical protein